ncbi:2-dehydro-3-deoxy-6-phosphogalactonate aldolase [uncultured Alsobacter sp.]|uniref:2-dehydro-3-deoxy-6-phosphogalactonate aldolase n=1 Tax=uncultured Alsobacter sp. TaxID=1748258 RepID=UPI0025D93203|nr:2-dehydro-3-deoxy-6-phosphogalactonate aldolase [uncultured Alsobacter sp.]
MTDSSATLGAFEAAFARCPLIAILRGLKPDEALAVGEALVGAGIGVLEVPLNSPEPFDSIGHLSRALAGRAVVGAGTVLKPADVDRLAEVGGTLVVSPNCSPDVIRRTKALGLVSAPGVMTPTEAFTALDAGADVLKLFPGELVGPAGAKAMAAVLPKGVRIVMVGGVTADGLGAYKGGPVAGFGIGSALFSPGVTAEEVERRARKFVAAWAAAQAG